VLLEEKDFIVNSREEQEAVVKAVFKQNLG
jgi:hypothetical protein